jgi:hypothetical protein
VTVNSKDPRFQQLDELSRAGKLYTPEGIALAREIYGEMHDEMSEVSETIHGIFDKYASEDRESCVDPLRMGSIAATALSDVMKFFWAATLTRYINDRIEEFGDVDPEAEGALEEVNAVTGAAQKHFYSAVMKIAQANVQQSFEASVDGILADALKEEGRLN